MPKKVPFVPKGDAVLNPYLAVKGAKEAIRWYTKVLGGKFLYQLDMPGGLVGHAEIDFDGIKLMLADENPSWENLGPKSVGGSPVTLHLYVKNVDKTYQKALAGGAKGKMEPGDQFYGHRSASFTDPFGHIWMIATQIEIVGVKEMKKRAKKLFGG